jgi:hypothetical protein
VWHMGRQEIPPKSNDRVEQIRDWQILRFGRTYLDRQVGLPVGTLPVITVLQTVSTVPVKILWVLLLLRSREAWPHNVVRGTRHASCQPSSLDNADPWLGLCAENVFDPPPKLTR